MVVLLALSSPRITIHSLWYLRRALQRIESIGDGRERNVGDGCGEETQSFHSRGTAIGEEDSASTLEHHSIEIKNVVLSPKTFGRPLSILTRYLPDGGGAERRFIMQRPRTPSNNY